MDITTLIKEDHDAAFALIERLERIAEDDADSQAPALVEELVLSIKLHAEAEERALYEALAMTRKDLRDFALEGYLEHRCLDDMLDVLTSLEPGGDGEFKAALTVCKELLEHHGREEEEGELFAKLRKAFSADELLALGATMAAEKEALRERLEREPADDEELDTDEKQPFAY